MLWLSARFPRLPLDLVLRGAPALAAGPCALMQRTARGDCVYIANPIAQQYGLYRTLPVNAALALAPALKQWPYDEAAEAAALTRLATLALRFSPTVALDPPRALLLEIAGSAHLFGGVEALCTTAAAEWTDIGFAPVLATAPYPAAAKAFTRAGQQEHIAEQATLERQLASLPLAALELGETALTEFSALGIGELGEIYRLPREGLIRRFGPELLALLDRLSGADDEAIKPFEPVLENTVHLMLPHEVSDTESLLFACNRLLKEFAGLLQAQSRGVRRFYIELRDDRGGVKRLPVGLLKAGNNAQHWFGLVRAHFERIQLERPVNAIAIVAAEIELLAPRNYDLFDSSESNAVMAAQLFERWQARLGRDAVKCLAMQADYRPEQAWCWTAPDAAIGRSVDDDDHRAGRHHPDPDTRPLWLYPEPVLLEENPVRNPAQGWRVSAVERIESGWWDNRDACRDYFIVESPQGERLWVFRDRRGARRWFVHGLFA